MANILTPVSLWKDFDDSLDVMAVTLGESLKDGVKLEYLNFSGRDTGMGRVTVFGVLATNVSNPSRECILVLRDGADDVEDELLSYFVKRGYSALCVDYSGVREGVERYTQYPENVSYANLSQCGRYKDFVDYSADKTCWYEWVAVGVYARKFLAERFSTEAIGLLGIRDGGEVAWKLATVAQFSCAVTVCACGWRAYKGIGKYEGEEPEFNDERYRFIAGIDSQSYAPYVKCPVLILCATGDKDFDYDRAYDTYSRINPEFSGLSSIAYSLNCGKKIDVRCSKDMFLFLDSYVKDRHVFMPKPAEISVSVDDEDNLIARVTADSMGIIEKCGVYFAEDNYECSSRDWAKVPLKRVVNANTSEFYLNVYEKTTSLFVFCYTLYSNGFTVWSKIAVKKVLGKFRNSRAKSKILYTSIFGTECFAAADCSSHAVGGVFLIDDECLPHVVDAFGLSGVYSNCGLMTNRIKSTQFLPDKDSILKFDVCSYEDSVVDVSVFSREEDELYSLKINVLGGVWQSQVLKAKLFKNTNGMPLSSFIGCEALTFNSSGKFLLNNLIWL